MCYLAVKGKSATGGGCWMPKSMPNNTAITMPTTMIFTRVEITKDSPNLAFLLPPLAPFFKLRRNRSVVRVTYHSRDIKSDDKPSPAFRESWCWWQSAASRAYNYLEQLSNLPPENAEP